MNSIETDPGKFERRVLVLGSPRSGTTLFAAMLGSHPEVVLFNENWKCNEHTILSKRVRGNKLCVPNQIELEHQEPNEKAALSIRDYQKITSLQIFGVLRSPEAVIKSIQVRGRQNLETAKFRWSRALEVLDQLHGEQGRHSAPIIVHFDRLLSVPELVMRKCLKSLGCAFSDEVLKGYKFTHQYPGNSKINMDKMGPGTDADLAFLDQAGLSQYKQIYSRLSKASV